MNAQAAAIMLAGAALLAACDSPAPAPAMEETTIAVDGREVTVEATPTPEASETAPPATTETPGTEATLINPHRVPSGDVAQDTAPLTAIPARFLGQWDALDGPCAPESEMFLTIRPGTLAFYESQGEVTGVRRGDPGVVISLAMAGEGETWVSEYAMRLVDGGEQLASRAVGESGADTLRRRCPALAGTDGPTP